MPVKKNLSSGGRPPEPRETVPGSGQDPDFPTGFAAWAAAWVTAACRRPRAVALLCLAAAAGLLWLAAATLSINTSTNDMLSEELPFRAQNEAVDAAFPQLVDTLTIAIEAPDALAAEAAAARLASALAAQPAVVQSVFLPQGGDFFRRNGLLYLSPEELQALGDRLAGAQPLLAALQADPSLRGLADLLAQATSEEASGEDAPAGGGDLAALLDRLAAVAEALPQDPGARLSWSALLSDTPETVEDRRRFVIVKPVIDFASLAPMAQAVAAVEAIVVVARLPFFIYPSVRVANIPRPAVMNTTSKTPMRIR